MTAEAPRATAASSREELSAERAIVRAVEIVAAVAPHLDVDIARGAVERVTSRTRSRNMISEHLAAHPTALVDGDSAAPAPVARLISELIAVGVEGVALPLCFDCGEPKPLMSRARRPGLRRLQGSSATGRAVFALRDGRASRDPRHGRLGGLRGHAITAFTCPRSTAAGCAA